MYDMAATAERRKPRDIVQMILANALKLLFRLGSEPRFDQLEGFGISLAVGDARHVAVQPLNQLARTFIL
jgi:hypothetical protein